MQTRQEKKKKVIVENPGPEECEKTSSSLSLKVMLDAKDSPLLVRARQNDCKQKANMRIESTYFQFLFVYPPLYLPTWTYDGQTEDTNTSDQFIP